jgi:[ribosomal protein S5]-alanine N-acetyltransferase
MAMIEKTPKTILETERLTLRQLSPDDAELILELLNEPSFLQYIGDRGVRTLADARQYILDGPAASYARFGFGLYRVALKETDVPIGMCGLLKRDSLEDVDIGFAFFPRFWSKGYAVESASAVMAYGREVLGLERIVAVTAPDNEASIRVLGKLGLKFAGMVKLAGYDTESRLFTPDA